MIGNFIGQMQPNNTVAGEQMSWTTEVFGSLAHTHITTSSSNRESVCGPVFLSVFSSDKYFMACLFSCLHWSSHLQLRFYTHLDTKKQSPTIIFSSPNVEAVKEGAEFQKSSTEQGIKGAGGDKDAGNRWHGETLIKGNLYFCEHPPVVSFPSQTGHTATLLCTQRERCVCADIFISPQDIVVMLVKCKPRQSNTVLSNRTLCKPMQRPLCSLCYSKLSVGGYW